MNFCFSEAPGTSRQKIGKVKYLQEILDTVQSLSDEEWESLKGSNEFSRLEFAIFCTDVVKTMSISVIANVLAKLVDVVGMEIVVKSEKVLKKRIDYRFCAGTSDVPKPSDKLTEFLCDVFESIVNGIIPAIQNVIRSIAAESVCRSGKKTNQLRPLAKEMMNALIDEYEKNPAVEGQGQVSLHLWDSDNDDANSKKVHFQILSASPLKSNDTNLVEDDHPTEVKIFPGVTFTNLSSGKPRHSEVPEDSMMKYLKSKAFKVVQVIADPCPTPDSQKQKQKQKRSATQREAVNSVQIQDRHSSPAVLCTFAEREKSPDRVTEVVSRGGTFSIRSNSPAKQRGRIQSPYFVTSLVSDKTKPCETKKVKHLASVLIQKAHQPSDDGGNSSDSSPEDANMKIFFNLQKDSDLSTLTMTLAEEASAPQIVHIMSYSSTSLLTPVNTDDNGESTGISQPLKDTVVDLTRPFRDFLINSLHKHEGEAEGVSENKSVRVRKMRYVAQLDSGSSDDDEGPVLRGTDDAPGKQAEVKVFRIQEGRCLHCSTSPVSERRSSPPRHAADKKKNELNLIRLDRNDQGNKVLTFKLGTDNQCPTTSENLQQDKSFMERTAVMFVPDTGRAPSPPSEKKPHKTRLRIVSAKR